jgi:hypothetical protein
MPESVTDRPTKAHSTVFLLSKSARYFYDQEALREPYKYDGRNVTHVEAGDGSIQHRSGERWPGLGRGTADRRRDTLDGGHDENEPMEISHSGANARSVWTIATEPTPFAHFATWPQKLVQRMMLAGTSERGVCPECGAPWVRETSDSYDAEGRTTNGQKPRTGGFDVRMVKSTSTLGWRPSCDCPAGAALMAQTDKELVPEPIPAVVLDPFGGSGTSALVARKLGRRAILIELNEDYCALAAERLAQQSLFAVET